MGAHEDCVWWNGLTTHSKNSSGDMIICSCWSCDGAEFSKSYLHYTSIIYPFISAPEMSNRTKHLICGDNLVLKWGFTSLSTTLNEENEPGLGNWYDVTQPQWLYSVVQSTDISKVFFLQNIVEHHGTHPVKSLTFHALICMKPINAHQSQTVNVEKYRNKII